MSLRRPSLPRHQGRYEERGDRRRWSIASASTGAAQAIRPSTGASRAESLPGTISASVRSVAKSRVRFPGPGSNLDTLDIAKFSEARAFWEGMVYKPNRDRAAILIGPGVNPADLSIAKLATGGCGLGSRPRALEPCLSVRIGPFDGRV